MSESDAWGVGISFRINRSLLHSHLPCFGLWGKYDDRSSAFLRGILIVTFRLAETPAD